MKNKYGKYIRVRKYEFINYSTMNHKIMIRLENEYKIDWIDNQEPCDYIHSDDVVAFITWIDLTDNNKIIYEKEYNVHEDDIYEFMITLISEEGVRFYLDKRSEQLVSNKEIK